jgi:hypothetical protein
MTDTLISNEQSLQPSTGLTRAYVLTAALVASMGGVAPHAEAHVYKSPRPRFEAFTAGDSFQCTFVAQRTNHTDVAIEDGDDQLLYTYDRAVTYAAAMGLPTDFPL